MNTLCLLIVLTVFSILYTLLCKNYTTNQSNICIVAIIILELVTLYFYIKLFEKNKMGSSYSQLTCLSVVLMTLIGIILYNEEPSRYIVLGIICAIISILLLR